MEGRMMMRARRSSSSSSSAAVAMVVVALVAAAWLVAEGEAAISCGTVSSYLASCVPYVTSTSQTNPSGACCGGVTGLYKATRGSRPDRITACGCIKSLAAALGSKLQASKIGALPGKCGVNLGYSISTSTNCASIP